ncbi:WD repeat-containing protein 76 isoform X2 [Corythoichthys intestinalis]|uniref:WD repeat-containing protein 76 isoform X2 n=1 Tax=Corythoichthys intestinalis TaxID=161448 RepID=UPI0025A5D5A9|nr:WD repeat-containing protein 76 isoform X2 [Corythoichthys intestinalis]
METRSSKRKADAKEKVVVPIEKVRKSVRTIQAPKRLQYSPPHAPQPRRKEHSIEHFQHEEEDSSNDENSEAEGRGLSAYELRRLENIRQKKAFLSSINLLQASHELKQSSPKRQPSQKTQTRCRLTPSMMLFCGGRSLPVMKEVLPSRKSRRLQNKSPEIQSLPSSVPELNKIKMPKRPTKSAGHLPRKPINMDDGNKLPPQLLQLFSEPQNQ